MKRTMDKKKDYNRLEDSCCSGKFHQDGKRSLPLGVKDKKKVFFLKLYVKYDEQYLDQP